MNHSGNHLGLALFLLLAIVSLQACHRNEPKVLPKQEFASVLCDVYITEALLTELDTSTKREWTRGMKSDYFQDVSYHWILDKYQICEDDFYTSVKYYSRTPKRMIEVLQMTTDMLKAKQQEVADRKAREEEERARLAYERTWKKPYTDMEFLALWSDVLLDTLPGIEFLDEMNHHLDLMLKATTYPSFQLADSCCQDSICSQDTVGIVPLTTIADSLQEPRRPLKLRDVALPNDAALSKEVRLASDSVLRLLKEMDR